MFCLYTYMYSKVNIQFHETKELKALPPARCHFHECNSHMCHDRSIHLRGSHIVSHVPLPCLMQSSWLSPRSVHQGCFQQTMFEIIRLKTNTI